MEKSIPRRALTASLVISLAASSLPLDAVAAAHNAFKGASFAPPMRAAAPLISPTTLTPNALPAAGLAPQMPGAPAQPSEAPPRLPAASAAAAAAPQPPPPENGRAASWDDALNRPIGSFETTTPGDKDDALEQRDRLNHQFDGTGGDRDSAAAASAPSSRPTVPLFERFRGKGVNDSAARPPATPPLGPTTRGQRLRERGRKTYAATLRVLATTTIEVYAMAALGLGIGGFMSYHHEAAREKSIPLGFSEISQLERDAAKEDRQLGPMTRYLASVNDLTMGVFESWNQSHERTFKGSNLPAFVNELSRRMDPSRRLHRRELNDYFEAAPSLASDALGELEPFAQARNKVAAANVQFDASWNDSHSHHYRTEVYWVTVSDSKGRSHSERRTRQVYSHTDHEYKYFRAPGEAASRLIDAALREHKGLNFPERMPTASQYHADNEKAANKSRALQRKEPLSRVEMREIAARWNSGSTLRQNLGPALSAWDALPGDADAWHAAKATAHDESYRTYHRSDAGPRQFQAAEKALEDGRQFAGKVGEVLDAIQFTRGAVPALEGKVRHLIEVERTPQTPEDPQALMRDIVSSAQQIYAKNFTGGFDVYPFRASMVALMALLGLAVGAALGGLIEYCENRYGWFGRGDYADRRR